MEPKIETYDDLEREILKYPIQFYNSDLELLKTAYKNRKITEPMLRNALDRNEITLKEYVKIINEPI